MAVQISILGLGQTGSSIGLALANAKDPVLRVGSDKDLDAAKKAQKLGAVEKIVISLADAAADADLVILAVPAAEVRFTLEAIAPHLKPGVVVLDTSPIPAVSSQWAADLIPAERYFLTFTPAVNARYLLEPDTGPASARANLFQDNVILITHKADVDPSAITLAENLAALLGAGSVFSSPEEVDGLLSEVNTLPAIAAAAAVNAIAGQPGWSDARKLAGPRFAQLGKLLETLDKQSASEITYNRENTLHAVDSLIGELAVLRDSLAAGSDDAFSSRIQVAKEAYTTWLSKRASGKWDDKPKAGALTRAGGALGGAIGRLFGRKPKGDEK